MSILSDFEDRIGGALEGLFAGVFRSPVQPVEIARSLAKAMDDGRTIGVGKVYAPLGFTVALSPDDDDNFGAFKTTLAGELATYLADHARERGYHLTAAPHVTFIVHDDLRLGRFRVSAELAAPEMREMPAPAWAAREVGTSAGSAAAPAIALAAGPTGAPADMPANGAPAALANPDVAPDATSVISPRPGHDAPPAATVTIGETGRTVVLSGDTVVVGRLATSGIRLADTNVSREHAAFVREGEGWAIVDLASTNGTLLNGEHVSRASLRDGDVVQIGLAELTYSGPEGASAR